jgi:hypothetical protein
MEGFGRLANMFRRPPDKDQSERAPSAQAQPAE